MTRPSDATRSTGPGPPPSVSVPSSRQPLPGPPPGGRPGGQLPPRFAPPPRRRLTPSQGSRLGLLAGVIVVLGATAGLAVSLLLPTQYAARTVIEYTVAQENASDFLRTDRNLTTQTVLLTSRNVLQPVADANGISVDALADKVQVSIVEGSEIIQVDVLDQSRERGLALAQGIVDRYLEVANSTGPRGYLERELAEVRRQLDIPGTAGTPPDPILQTRAATLQAQLDEINISGNKATVVVPPYSVAEPAFPKPLLAAATGALTGLVVAALVVLALSRRWTRS